MKTNTVQFTDINNDELKHMLQNQENQFVDVRTFNEFKQRTIKGFGINIDYYQMVHDFALIEDLDKEKPVVLMCATGVRSRVVANALIEVGFESVFNLKNGIAMWDGNTV